MQIALYFGSFNPIHTGHLIIAQHIANLGEVDQVWLVVSPHNPFKAKASLANDYDRLHLVNLSVEDNPKIRSCSIEFSLPQPSYTIDTLTHLEEKYPQHRFSLILGSDNLPTLHKWKNGDLILEKYKIYVYKRVGTDVPKAYEGQPSLHFCDAPLLDISASYIRECIQNGKSVRYMVADRVFEYLDGSNMYKSK
ncbi:MAG: nicotinate-nucleotide adenylyltransferase [Saprospiraceae bacterium]|nr:nicotinate-nucleotide adenylyltransferase [Saprospiraceae bacterium]